MPFFSVGYSGWKCETRLESSCTKYVGTWYYQWNIDKCLQGEVCLFGGSEDNEGNVFVGLGKNMFFFLLRSFPLLLLRILQRPSVYIWFGQGCRTSDLQAAGIPRNGKLHLPPPIKTIFLIGAIIFNNWKTQRKTDWIMQITLISYLN